MTHGRVQIGSVIAAIGGLIFVLVNAGSLPPAVVLPVRILGVLAFAAVIGLVATRPWATQRAPSPTSWRIYFSSVALMVVLLPTGAGVLERILGLSELQLPWVVLVVGAHFVPMAVAFEARVFAWLGATMMVTAVVGACVVLRTGPQPAGWIGVAAGLELLMASAWPALQHRPRLLQ